MKERHIESLTVRRNGFIFPSHSVRSYKSIYSEISKFPIVPQHGFQVDFVNPSLTFVHTPISLVTGTLRRKRRAPPGIPIHSCSSGKVKVFGNGIFQGTRGDDPVADIINRQLVSRKIRVLSPRVVGHQVFFLLSKAPGTQQCRVCTYWYGAQPIRISFSPFYIHIRRKRKNRLKGVTGRVRKPGSVLSPLFGVKYFRIKGQFFSKFTARSNGHVQTVKPGVWNYRRTSHIRCIKTKSLRFAAS